MTPEDYTKRMWDMLDDPQAYSEEEILDLLRDNEEARQTYRQMVEVKRSYRQRRISDQAVDVDRAWERFASEHPVQDKKHKPLLFSRFTGMRGYAAIGICVLLMSGLSYAAIIQIRHRNEVRKEEHAATEIKSVPRQTETPVVITDTLQVKSKTFDNVPLGEMLPEIADYYGMKVRFLSAEMKELRLFFTWNPKEPIDKVISKLNQFERLNVKRDGQNVIVE